MKTGLDSIRTRWRRWLGQKTRLDKPTWVTLLDSTWLGWVDHVESQCDLLYEHRSLPEITREHVKERWLSAINAADMKMLRRLDEIYAAEKLGL